MRSTDTQVDTYFSTRFSHPLQLTGSTINVSGGGNSFTLEFDPEGTDSSNDLLLGTTSGFTGIMANASGTSDVIGTSCQPD